MNRVKHEIYLNGMHQTGNMVDLSVFTNNEKLVLGKVPMPSASPEIGDALVFWVPLDTLPNSSREFIERCYHAGEIITVRFGKTEITGTLGKPSEGNPADSTGPAGPTIRMALFGKIQDILSVKRFKRFSNEDLLTNNPIGKLTVAGNEILIQQQSGDFVNDMIVSFSANNWTESERGYLQRLSNANQAVECRYTLFSDGFDDEDSIVDFVGKVLSCQLVQTVDHRQAPHFRMRVMQTGCEQ